MKRKRYSEEQITFALRQHESGTAVAEIVRKIGKITKYETKSYVGEQKILDLDKAINDDRESAGE